jgi:hypothetical protein
VASASSSLGTSSPLFFCVSKRPSGQRYGEGYSPDRGICHIVGFMCDGFNGTLRLSGYFSSAPPAQYTFSVSYLVLFFDLHVAFGPDCNYADC